jgi:hypothetical protein
MFFEMNDTGDQTINVKHITKIKKSVLTSTFNVEYTISMTWSNGTKEDFKYNKKEERDKVFEKLLFLSF